MKPEYRYTRRQPQPSQQLTYPRITSTSGNLDLYNALLQSPQGPPLEYWTNGSTTLIMSSGEERLSQLAAEAPIPADSLRRMMTRQNSRLSAPPAAASNATNNDLLVRHSLIAGSISGMASTVALYPLDLLRTKLQTAGLAQVTASSAVATVSGTAALASQPLQPSTAGLGPWQMLRHTLRHGGGLPALYTGMTLPLAAQAVYKGTVFTVNNVTQTFLLDFRTLENHKLGDLRPGELTWSDRFWCGCLGGAVNAYLFVTPVEFVRNQLIAQQTQRSSSGSSIWSTSALSSSSPSSPSSSYSWGVIRSCVRHHGVSSLWRGAAWSVARDGWGCGWFFVTMHYAPHFIAPLLQAATCSRSSSGGDDVPVSPTSFPITVAAGGMAGLAYWVASLPLDTVKTWIQSADPGGQTVSAAEAVRLIWKQHGVQGVLRQLFRGWQVAYGRGIPSAAITITLYSMVFDRLQATG